MARATKDEAKKPDPKKGKRSTKKRTPQPTTNLDQDTTDVLHGPLHDVIREAFLKRP